MKNVILIFIAILLIYGCAGTIDQIHIEENGIATVGVDKSNWVVSFPDHGFKYDKKIATHSFAYFMLSNGDTILSIMIEPATLCDSAVSCRDRAIRNIKEDNKAYGFKTWEKDDYALSKFFSKRGGVFLLHMNKHGLKDGFWYDIHYSRKDPGDKDEKDAIDYLDSIKIILKSDDKQMHKNHTLKYEI